MTLSYLTPCCFVLDCPEAAHHCITKFKHNGAIIEDGKLVAGKFNKYFVNICESLAKSIPQSKRKPDEYINFKTSECFYLTEVTENEINAIIGNFNNSSPGWDELKQKC